MNNPSNERPMRDISDDRRMRVAAVIPAYKVTEHVLGVIAAMPAVVERIYVVDDCCPEKSGDFVEANNTDPRVKVLRNGVNQGVGGAVVTGYKAAMAEGIDIAVKVDGDGQMNPELLPAFIAPILAHQADYTKGTRFFSYGTVRSMPGVRLFGNAVLSFISKAVSGYWGNMDPTNGYTAIHTSVLRLLPLDLIEKRYFFESDMLFHLGIVRAVVADVPMFALYGNEVSNLHIGQVLRDFPKRYGVRFMKRFFYNYLLRDFNAGSLATILGLPLFAFGVLFGGIRWISALTGTVNSAGTIMLSALPILIGIQLLVTALMFDIANQPRAPLHRSAQALAPRDPTQRS